MNSKFILIIINILAAHSIILGTGLRDTVIIDEDLYLAKLTEHTYLHRSYMSDERWGRFSSNGLIYIVGDSAIIMDTPVNNQLTGKLIDWLNDSAGVKIKAFIPTHWHMDCLGGLEEVQRRNIPSYSGKLTREITISKGLPVPDISFNDTLTVNIGDKKIFCKYPGPAHTVDNIVVWLPDEKVLFGGCMIKSLEFSSLGNIADSDIASWASSAERVKKDFPKAKIVIPGHGTPGGIELIKHTIKLANKAKMK